MHRFLYLLQQRQTRRFCLHLAIGSEKAFQEQKGKGKNYDKGGKPDNAKGGKSEFEKGGKPEFAKGGKDEKGGKDDKGGKNVAKGEFKGEFKGKEGEKGKQGPKGPTLPPPKASGSKCARISEEPPEIVEGNSNKMHDNGAMTDGSKRRHEAVESNSDAESASSVFGELFIHLRHRRLPATISKGAIRAASNPQVGCKLEGCHHRL